VEPKGEVPVSTAGWTISIVAILIVMVIAWREFGRTR
jgi:hypothetical protein